MPPRGYCGGCRGPVLWVVLDSGKRMPVETTPAPDGTVAVMRDAHGTWVGHVLRADQQPQPYERRHVTHFATCPAYRAEQERRAARRQQEAAVASAPNVTSLADYTGRRRGGR